jgi:hypothetical protein
MKIPGIWALGGKIDCKALGAALELYQGSRAKAPQGLQFPY